MCKKFPVLYSLDRKLNSVSTFTLSCHFRLHGYFRFKEKTKKKIVTN
jgi:hypothetical protein